MASLWKLPILHLCENNLYGMGTAVERASAVASMAEKACAYNIPAVRVDGMDVRKMYEATQKALEHIRSGKGPYFIEAIAILARIAIASMKYGPLPERICPSAFFVSSLHLAHIHAVYAHSRDVIGAGFSRPLKQPPKRVDRRAHAVAVVLTQ